MTRRTTNVGVLVEYKPEHKVRTTNVGALVEYKPVHKIRTTNVGLMIEYVQLAAPVGGIINGPILQNH